MFARKRYYTSQVAVWKLVSWLAINSITCGVQNCVFNCNIQVFYDPRKLIVVGGRKAGQYFSNLATHFVVCYCYLQNTSCVTHHSTHQQPPTTQSASITGCLVRPNYLGVHKNYRNVLLSLNLHTSSSSVEGGVEKLKRWPNQLTKRLLPKIE